MALTHIPTVTLHNADCLAILASMPAASVDAIITDPPYYKVKTDAWDRQWKTADAFAAWMGQVLDQFARVLKPNGSLYIFASPQMAARVEILVAERLRVLNHIVWAKPTGRHLGTCRAAQRAYFPQTERIIFAEHYHAEKAAQGLAGYAAQCAELRRSVFEPLRAYLDGERERAGFTGAEIDAAWRQWRGAKSKGGMSGHWFGRSQWAMPTRENYEWLQRLLNSRTAGTLSTTHQVLADDYTHLQANYEVLRTDYDQLKQQYQSLRRPFTMGKTDPHTDVWTFAPVPPRPGKHPCEKPIELMRHIVARSTRPGMVVLDAFMGSGATGSAAAAAACDFIGIEQNQMIYQTAAARLMASEDVATSLSV